MMLTRKNVLTAGLAVAGVGLLSAGCGPPSAGRSPDGGPGANDAGTSDAGAGVCSKGAVHTSLSDPAHALAIPATDITAGVDKTYSIMGTSPHDHFVSITAAMFTQLRNGQTFNVTSTSGGPVPHTHVVAVACAT